MNNSAKKQGLRSKTVVITGASSGVGRAAALEFAKWGANLVLAARREEALQDVVERCAALGALAIAVPTDVTKTEEVEQLAEAADDFGDGIDVWINNAGVLAVGPFDETPTEVNTRVIETNLLGYMNGAHAVLPHFKRQGHGILINNISVGGWYPAPYGTAYTASKFGLRGLTGALQAELSAWPDIHVCGLYPAFLDTPGIQHAANYTGVVLKPAPPIFPPSRVAKAMVSLARHPRRASSPDLAAPAMRLLHALAPRLCGRVTEALFRSYFKIGKSSGATSGNLFDDNAPLTSVEGGWKTQRTITAAGNGLLVGAAVIGLLSLLRKS